MNELKKHFINIIFKNVIINEDNTKIQDGIKRVTRKL